MSKSPNAIFGRFARLIRRRNHGVTSPTSDSLQFESLEQRQLLAIDTNLPAIVGTVYVDANSNSTLDAGEELEGASIQLWEDDGDGSFDSSLDSQVTAQTTDADGDYCFDGLDLGAQYFVVQIAQTVSGNVLSQQVSAAIEASSLNLIIDTFETNQSAVAQTPSPTSDTSTLSFLDETEVIGQERDMSIELAPGSPAGAVELLVNGFGNPVFDKASTGGAIAEAILTWDGIDANATQPPAMGLGGRDLTQGGINTGISMEIGTDVSGQGDIVTIEIYQGDASNVSTASAPVPVTDGTATGFAFIPFTDFTGPVDPSNVDAIQLRVGNPTLPSVDTQIGNIGVIGAKVFDIENEPTIDLQITKNNATSTVVAGETISYEIIVENLGPVDAVDAVVTDTFPTEIENVTYTSVVTGTVTGNTASGSGDINDTVSMTAGSTITYTVSGTVAADATGTITNTATVDAPTGITENDLTNNSDDETDNIEVQVDLAITKDDGVTEANPGDVLTYTIVASNNGPSHVVGATIVDTFPGEVSNVTYTSSVSGTASGNTASGSGNISDTVDMAPGSSITYTVTGTVGATATGSILNIATITAPTSVTETDTTNNTAEDEDTIPPRIDLSITKTDNVTVAVPGETLTYTIVVENQGPTDATGATVVDDFPTQLTNVTYTSTVTGGATGNTASGSGNINDTVDMPNGSSITYTVTGTVDASATGTVENTATVTAPAGLTETDLTNNEATDIDTITPRVDLAVTKDDGVDVVAQGDQLTYTIIVSNNGPSDAVGATFTDTFPSSLTNVSYTSTSSGGATGNTANGTGNLSETLDLPAGSSVTYTVTATVASGATGTVVNTATVTAPTSVTETDTSNNTATDTDTLQTLVDLSITKTNNVTSVTQNSSTTYTILVTNDGPDDVVGATVIDNFPSDFVNPTYTSVTTNGATGNTATGSGSINDVVDMPAFSTITYTVTGTVAVDATGNLINTATVSPPNDVTDTDTTNNTSTDTDPISELLAQVSGFVYVDANDSGTFDSGETPIPNVLIELLQNGTTIASTNTDSDGFYSFENLSAGTYNVQQTQPSGFDDGQDTAEGGQGTVIDNDLFQVTLAPGDDAQRLNFGELEQSIDVIQPSKRDLLASAFRT